MNMQNYGQSDFRKFMRENRSLVYSIPILLVLLIAVIIVYSRMGTSQDQTAVSAAAGNPELAAKAVQILPDTEREANNDGSADQKKRIDNESNSEIKDPFSGPVTLHGILLDGKGNGIAVIETDNKSYIVRKDDILGNDMTISSIATDGITLKEGSREVVLKLEKQNSSKTAGN